GEVQVLADVGLGFVFLLAGYEVDLHVFGEDAGRRAVIGWFVSVGLALAVTGVLAGGGLVHAFVPVALGLTTTALGTLLPILRDQFRLDAVLGAFLAGVVLRHWAGPSAPVLESKLDAVGYGFFIPVFFVYSGMSLDLPLLAAAPLRLLLFFGLMVAVRGLPAF